MSHHPPQQRNLHLLRRKPAVVAEVFLLETPQLVPPNRLPAIRQHDQVPHAAQERLRDRRRAEEARRDQVGGAIDDCPPRQPGRETVRLVQKLVSDVQKEVAWRTGGIDQLPMPVPLRKLSQPAKSGCVLR